MSLVGYKIVYGLQMAESQPPIMIYVMIGTVVVNHLRCGEMEGLIRLIATGHKKRSMI